MAVRGNPGAGKQGQGALPPGPPPGDKSPGPLGGFRVGGGWRSGPGAGGSAGDASAIALASPVLPPAPGPDRHPPPTRNQRMGSKGSALGGGSRGAAPPWPCLPAPGFPRIPIGTHRSSAALSGAAAGWCRARASRCQVVGPKVRYCGRWSRRARRTHWVATRRWRCAAQAAKPVRKAAGSSSGRASSRRAMACSVRSAGRGRRASWTSETRS